MKSTTLFLATFFLAGGNVFAGDSLMSKAADLRSLFDSGLGFKSDTAISAPFAGGNWGAAPKIKSSGAKETRMPYRDAFDLDACGVIDAVYIRRPSLEESVNALNACLRAVSKEYRTDIKAAQGDGELVIVISGIIPAGSTVTADLRYALEMRAGSLFGHAARILHLGSSTGERKMSSLQFVVDRCPTIKMVSKITSARDFLGIYGRCIKEAPGLEILAVITHPTESRGIVVYSKDNKDTIAEMNGVIRVPSDAGAFQVQVNAVQEALSRSLFQPQS